MDRAGRPTLQKADFLLLQTTPPTEEEAVQKVVSQGVHALINTAYFPQIVLKYGRTASVQILYPAALGWRRSGMIHFVSPFLSSHLALKSTQITLSPSA